MELSFGTRIEMNLGDFEQIVSQAQAAERAGFEAAWVRDHLHIPESGGGDDNLECFATLNALARETRTIMLGSLVACVPFRNPALLAKMGASLDIISHGRAIMGVGAGGSPGEFEEYGFTLPETRDRALMLREAVQILKGMWGPEHAFSFQGRYYRTASAVNEPKPVQQGGPAIVVGSSGKDFGLKTIARFADGWSINFGNPRFGELDDALRQACDEAGRDRATITTYVGFHALVAATHEEAQARKRAAIEAGQGGTLGNRWFAGTAEELMDYLRQFTDRGVRHFITYFHEPGRHNESIQEFGELMIPRKTATTPASAAGGRQ